MQISKKFDVYNQFLNRVAGNTKIVQGRRLYRQAVTTCLYESNQKAIPPSHS